MSKLRVFGIQLLATVLIAAAGLLDASSELVGSWWTVVGAGTCAMLLSRARSAIVIATTLVVFTGVVALIAAAAFASSDTAFPPVLLLATASGIQVFTLRGLLRRPAAWQTSVRYDSRPANPWNAVDQGIDPTL